MSCAPESPIIDGGPGSGGGSVASTLAAASGILLVDNTESLEIVTSSAVQIEVTVSFVDLPSGLGGGTPVTIAAAGTTTIVAAPASGTRQVRQISVRNTDASSPINVTLQKDVSGTNYPIMALSTIRAGESLVFEERVVPWAIKDAQGRERTDDVGISESGPVAKQGYFATANITTARTFTSPLSIAAYLGRCTRRLTSVTGCFRVTTGAAGVTWAEVAIATGAPVLAGNPTLTVRGFTDIAASITGTGIMRIVITVQSGAIPRGSDIWLMVGQNATVTQAQIRCSSYDDQLQMGQSCRAASRPSVILNTPTAFTVDTTENLPLYNVAD
jgi:hypothetical protein